MLRQLAHIHAVERDAAGGDVVKARDQVDQRRFAAARRADERRRLAGARGEADVLEHVFICAPVAERDVLELDHASYLFRQLFGPLGIPHAALALQHVGDAPRRNGRARRHHEHHADHQKAHDDLHGVLDERHHVAHLHGGIRDLVPAHPHNQQRHAIHYKHHHRHHGGHHAGTEQVDVCQLAVGFVEALFLKLLRRERADHHHTGQIFTADKIELIDQLLHQLETRHQQRAHGRDQTQDQHDGQRDDPRHATAFAQRHERAADADDGRVAHRAQAHRHKALDLHHVVGAAGDQAGRAETVKFVVCKACDAGENIAAQIARDARAHAAAAKAYADGARGQQQRQQEHFAARAEDIARLDRVRIRAELHIKALGKHRSRLATHAFGRGGGLTDGLVHHFPGQLLQHRQQSGEARHGIGRAAKRVIQPRQRVGVERGVAPECLRFRCSGPFLLEVRPRSGAHRVRVRRQIGRFDQRTVVLVHKHSHQPQAVGRNGARRGLIDAALLNANVDKVAHQIRQVEVDRRLAEHQHNHSQREAEIRLQIPLQSQHGKSLSFVSFFRCFARGLF